jgi:hypothetical protein
VTQLALSVLLKSSSVAIPFRHQSSRSPKAIPTAPKPSPDIRQVRVELYRFALAAAVQFETSGVVAGARHCHEDTWNMFKLIATMRRGSAANLAPAWARYPTMEAARLGTAALLRDDRVLRVMIVRNEIPPAFVEWAER